MVNNIKTFKENEKEFRIELKSTILGRRGEEAVHEEVDKYKDDYQILEGIRLRNLNQNMNHKSAEVQNQVHIDCIKRTLSEHLKKEYKVYGIIVSANSNVKINNDRQCVIIRAGLIKQELDKTNDNLTLEEITNITHTLIDKDLGSMTVSVNNYVRSTTYSLLNICNMIEAFHQQKKEDLGEILYYYRKSLLDFTSGLLLEPNDDLKKINGDLQRIKAYMANIEEYIRNNKNKTIGELRLRGISITHSKVINVGNGDYEDKTIAEVEEEMEYQVKQNTYSEETYNYFEYIYGKEETV